MRFRIWHLFVFVFIAALATAGIRLEFFGSIVTTGEYHWKVEICRSGNEYDLTRYRLVKRDDVRAIIESRRTTLRHASETEWPEFTPLEDGFNTIAIPMVQRRSPIFGRHLSTDFPIGGFVMEIHDGRPGSSSNRWVITYAEQWLDEPFHSYLLHERDVTWRPELECKYKGVRIFEVPQFAEVNDQELNW